MSYIIQNYGENYGIWFADEEYSDREPIEIFINKDQAQEWIDLHEVRR